MKERLTIALCIALAINLAFAVYHLSRLVPPWLPDLGGPPCAECTPSRCRVASGNQMCCEALTPTGDM